MKRIYLTVILLISVGILSACGDGSLPAFEPAPKSKPTPSLVTPEALPLILTVSPQTMMIADIMEKCPTFFACHKANLELVRKVGQITMTQHSLLSSTPATVVETSDEIPQVITTPPHLLGGSISSMMFMMSGNSDK